MKTILKTFPNDLELKYDEKFTSEANDEILRQIIPRLIEAMKPTFNPRYKQVKTWLAALHKHRRVRLLYKQRGTLDKDNRRLHRNNRLNEVDNFLFFKKKKKFLKFNQTLNIEKDT